MTEMRTEIKQEKKNNWIRSVSVYQILGGMLAATALAAFIAIWVSYTTGRNEYASLRQYVTVLSGGNAADAEKVTDMDEESKEPLQEEAPNEQVSLVVDFDDLKQINPDIVAWIAFDNIDISYPVVQRDNSYYLSHTFEGKENVSGCIFMDEKNASDFSDNHTILYGHNMKNGTMFGMLKNYKEQEYLEENRYFTIYTPDAEYRYEISSARTVSVEHSLFTQTDLGGEDKVVTLSTCTYSDDLRFVVSGVCISCTFE